MNPKLEQYCASLTKNFDQVTAQRKELLEKISHYIATKQQNNKAVNLVYICTHNSRRSHFGQVWAQVAANYFKVDNVNTFSGGTEATAFNTNAINALDQAGFHIEKISGDNNPVYHVYPGDHEKPVVCFSKIYDHETNPRKEFAAIMTCGEAEENCPFIPGAELRIATTYDDPKVFDNTPQQDEKYDERCRQIAVETFYVFSKVKNNLQVK